MTASITPAELFAEVSRNAAAQVDVCSHTDDITGPDIFIATGTGTEYVQAALDNGAIAVVFEAGSALNGIDCQQNGFYGVQDLKAFTLELLHEVYGSDIAKANLIGITGTNGKTSSAHFTCQLLNLLGDKTGYIGTLGHGVNTDSLIKGRNTTPDVVTLYRYISLLQRKGCKYIVMEVSSHGIALERIAGLGFSIGAFTNFSRDHLDFHLTMQSYEATKLSLFRDYPVGKVVVNADDKTGIKLIEKWLHEGKENLYGFTTDEGKSEYFQYSYESKTVDTEPCIVMSYQQSVLRFPVAVAGQYNIENFITAILICHARGYSLQTIAAYTQQVGVVPGRLEASSILKYQNVYVDYAHTPDAMKAVLIDSTLQEADTRIKYCIFGCGGKRDAGKRVKMGDVASQNADKVVLTDDNTRGESAEKILCDISAGIKNKTGLVICRDRAKAIAHVLESASQDDLVLILGKGDESSMDYGHYQIPHKDIDVVNGMAAA